HVPMTNMYRDDPWLWPAHTAAADLYAMAGIEPNDVDVLQMYDMFSPVVLYGIEAYGFCGRGEAGAFVCDGHIDSVDAKLPTNTAGGSLSEAYIHGFNLILEAVRQLRGTASNPVENAEVAVVSAAPVVPSSAIALRR
ncbi:MAG: lipid-transfer protein, partial [Myxococcota bacterium]